MAKETKKTSGKKPTDEEEFFEQIGNGIGEALKASLAKRDSAIEAVTTKADATAKDVDDLRKEVDKIKAHPSLTPSTARALVRGVKQGLK